MSAAVKPEIFISWIPQGKIGLTPLIFATYIHTPIHEKISADTKRNVSKTESSGVDLQRQIGNSENSPADTRRNIQRNEKIIGDTARKIGVAKISGDLQRRVNVNIKSTFDTCRQIGNREKISAGTKRIVANQETAAGDTLLQTAATEKVSADLTCRLRDIVRADTSRKVTRTEKTVARTVIRVPHILKYTLRSQSTLHKAKFLADNPASLVSTFEDYGVTAINIALRERTLSDEFRFDITQPVEINDAVQGDFLDYPFDFLVEETNQTDLTQSVKGRYSIDDQLYTWIHFEVAEDDTYTAAAFMQLAAQYLGLTADIRIDDFTPSNLDGDNTITYADLLNTLFSWTSRLPQRQINVFIRGRTLHVIQRGKEDSVFDITDLPHSRPTVNKKFNRVLCHNPNNDDTDDDDDDDDDNIKFSGTIAYRKDGIAPYQERIYLAMTYNHGLLTLERLTTQTGLFANEDGEIVMMSNISKTSYGYMSKINSKTSETEHYMSSKQQETTTRTQHFDEGEDYLAIDVTKQSTTTNYYYNDDFDENTNEGITYLYHENEVTNTEEYREGKDDKITSNTIRDTYHIPVGNGWYAQIVYQNGILQGANLSQGKPGSEVSPYTVKGFQQTFLGTKITNDEGDDNDDISNELSAIVDDSFPVRESEIKDTLNEALRWLHRKIQETVTVDLTAEVVGGVPAINHIVDFTDRVRLDGAEYFLVSNSISFTPRKLIQKLQLIRWY